VTEMRRKKEIHCYRVFSYHTLDLNISTIEEKKKERERRRRRRRRRRRKVVGKYNGNNTIIK
jgi:hypothetical protein